MALRHAIVVTASHAVRSGSVSHIPTAAGPSGHQVSEIVRAERLEEAESGLAARYRRERFVHDNLLRQLRTAAGTRQFDVVEWKRLRSELAAAAPQLRPDELALALEGLAALRSVESNYLFPVLQSLGHLAHYMSGPQLVTSLTALASLASPLKVAGSTNSEGVPWNVFQPQALLLTEILQHRLGHLSPEHLLQLLRALRQLRHLPTGVLHEVLEHLPRASRVNTADLHELLSLLRAVTEDLKATCTSGSAEDSVKRCLCSLHAVLLDVRSAVRVRLKELSQHETLMTLMHSVTLERAIDTLQSSPALKFESVSELLSVRGLRQLGIGGSGSTFHRLLLGELAIQHVMLEWLGPRDCAKLACVLAELARSDVLVASSKSVRSQFPPTPPPYIARLCPILLDRLLEVLELLRPDELVDVLEALSLGLGYRDDYVADRFAEALKSRLVPIHGGPPQRASQLRRALRALAWQRPVGFLELLSVVLEDVKFQIESRVQLGSSVKERLCSCFDVATGSAVGLHRSDDCASDLQWLSAVVQHFRQREGPSAQPSLTAATAATPSGEELDNVAGWALDGALLHETRLCWQWMCSWYRGEAQVPDP